MSTIETLRPGLLISLKTSVRGNVKYDKRDLSVSKIDAEGKEIAEWETKRTIADPIEYDRAIKVRTVARQLISSVCVNSAFGLLCPEKAQEELSAAVVEAHRVVDEFNRSAKLTRVSMYAMIGKVAADDVEAVRAINSEVSDLMTQMEEGLKNLDVKSIREAAVKAKQIGQMLAPDAAARIQIAVETARASAREIVKAGEQAAAEIDLRAIRTVTDMRTAFLDLGEAVEVAAPKADSRALDLTPEVAVTKTKATRREIEI